MAVRKRFTKTVVLRSFPRELNRVSSMTNVESSVFGCLSDGLGSPRGSSTSGIGASRGRAMVAVTVTGSGTMFGGN